MADRPATRLLADRRLWLMAAYGFVAGLPLPLSGFTFRLWLSEGGVSLAVIGLTANIGLAYSLKFLWAPLLDNAPPPGPLSRFGRRRGWLLAIQPLLVAAAVLLALSNPAVVLRVRIIQHVLKQQARRPLEGLPVLGCWKSN